jgi:ATP-dependent RNA helicase DDX55/SPB4
MTLESYFDTRLIQMACESDRDLYDKSVLAFVSFIRSYQAHQAKYIFDLSKLDMVSVMRSFGILKVPKMPELRKFDLNGFTESLVNLDEIGYKDAKREGARKIRPVKQVVRKVKTVAWSEKKGVKERREERREKRERRRVAKSKVV